MIKTIITLYKKIIRENLLFDDLFILDSPKEPYTYELGEEITNWTREIALRPCRSKTMVLDGLQKAALGDWEGSILEYTNAIHINPGLVAGWFYRAGAHSRLSHLDETNFDYVNAIYRARGNLKILFNYAVCNAHFWLFRVALQNFEEVIKCDDTVAEFYLYRGRTKSMLDDHPGALADYNRAEELDPSTRIFHSGRGIARLVTGDFKGAIEDLDIDISNNPLKDQCWFNRGIARLAMDDNRRAMDDFDHVLLANNSIRNASTLKGFALLQMEDFQGALSIFQTMIHTSPQNQIAWFGKGLTNLALGNNYGYVDLVKSGEFGFKKAFEIIKIV